MNPCTLGWYLPLLVKDVPGALQPSDGRHGTGAVRAGGTIGQKDGSKFGARGAGADGASRDDHHVALQQGSTTITSTSTTAPAANMNAKGLRTSKNANAKGSGGGLGSWQELDARFRRDLPDEAYVGRLGYRGLVMRACPAIRVLDGVEVSAKEREKAERLLQSVEQGKVKAGTAAATGVDAE